MSDAVRVSDWRRLTSNQREYMLRFHKNRGSLYCVSGNRRVIFSLAHKQLIETFDGGWYHLTQRGREYLRFGLMRPWGWPAPESEARRMTRRWIRKGRTYRYFGTDIQALIFGADGGLTIWAWGVWASKNGAEGIAFSLKQAKLRASEKLDELEAERGK